MDVTLWESVMTNTEETGSKLRWLWLAVLVIVLDLGSKAMATAMLTYGNPGTGNATVQSDLAAQHRCGV